MQKKIRKALKKTINSFIRGLLLIVPFTLTIYFLSLAFRFFNNIIGLEASGWGLIFLLIAITIFGHLGSTIIIQSVLFVLEGLIDKIPVVSDIYESLKTFILSFSNKKKKFSKPILVTFNQELKIQEIGFITQENLRELDLPGSVSVFFPSSYAFGGRLLFVSKKIIEPLKMSSAEAMTFLISGGLLKTFGDESSGAAAPKTREGAN